MLFMSFFGVKKNFVHRVGFEIGNAADIMNSKRRDSLKLRNRIKSIEMARKKRMEEGIKTFQIHVTLRPSSRFPQFSTHKFEVDKETTIEELKIVIKNEMGGNISKRRIEDIILFKEGEEKSEILDNSKALKEECTLGELGLVGDNAKVETPSDRYW